MKLLNLEKIQFKINWASGVTLFAAIVAAVYFYVENQGYKAKINSIPDLKKTINEQAKAISALESSNTTFNNTIQAFMANPPSAMKAEINALKMLINHYHPAHHYAPPITQPTSAPDTASFVGNKPPNINPNGQ